MSATRSMRAVKPRQASAPAKKEARVSGPLRRVRKKHRLDKAYNPRSDRRGGHGDGALNILTDASKTVTDENGDKKPKKTAYLFASPAKSLLDEKAQKSLKDKVKEVPTNCPATAVEWFANGVPRVLMTPKGTALNFRGGAEGIGYGYVNRSPLSSLTDAKVDAAFKSSAEAQALVPNPHRVKKQKKLLTKAMLQKADRDARHDNGVRSVSQAAVMKNKGADLKDVSATKVAEAAGIAVGVPKHFGHALGHQFFRSKSQVPLNLSIVTKHSNGAYLAQAEYVLRYLVKQCDKVLFTANAHCFKNGGHIQEKLEVVLEVPGAFTLRMTFDGQQLSPADKSSKDYMLSLARVLVEQRVRKAKKTETEAASVATVAASESPDIFFSRKENSKMLEKQQSKADKENQAAANTAAVSTADKTRRKLF